VHRLIRREQLVSITPNRVLQSKRFFALRQPKQMGSSREMETHRDRRSSVCLCDHLLSSFLLMIVDAFESLFDNLSFKLGELLNKCQFNNLLRLNICNETIVSCLMFRWLLLNIERASWVDLQGGSPISFLHYLERFKVNLVFECLASVIVQQLTHI
jgi:hypothetical protein